MRAIRIPGLIDLVRTDEPDEIRAFARDPRLDRRFEAKGPLLNRLILRRIRRVLQSGGRPLPPVAPREDRERQEAQAELEAKLSAPGAPADEESLSALARYVRGEASERTLGATVQQAIGSRFADSYRGDSRSWKAARVLNGCVRPFRPMGVIWRLTGALGRSRVHLADLCGQDRSGVHATGIAVHNLVESLRRMRKLAATRGALARYAPEEAASLSLSAPDTVPREAVDRGVNGVTGYRPGTLVLLQLEKARERTLSPEMAFMTSGWSRCPAHAWVPALLAAVWERAR
jgi:hypothetical protein